MPYRWLEIALASLAGIEPGEVLQALTATRRLPIPGTARDVEVLGIIAPTRAGRLLTVVLRHDEGFDWLIAGARDANEIERAAYKRWEGQR